VSKEEMDLRILVFNFHRNSEKYKIFKDSHPPGAFNEFITALSEEKNKIINNEVFKQIQDKKRREDILQGKTAYCLTREEIEQKLEFDTVSFGQAFKLLSNFAHNTPFSFMSPDPENVRGLRTDGVVEQYSNCLEMLVGYLAMAQIGLIDMFKDRAFEKNKDAYYFSKKLFEDAEPPDADL
jgi:hypothetical protein